MDKKVYDALINASCQDARKRLFIGLLIILAGVLCCFFLVFLIIPWLGDNWRYLRFAGVTVGVALIVVTSLFCVNTIISLYYPYYIFDFKKFRYVILKFLLPLMESTGKLFNFKKEDIRKSFVKINNEYVLQHLDLKPDSRILLLLPHCVQNSECGARLLYNLKNCKNCGRCQVGGAIALSRKHNVRVAVATGGTIARKIVKEERPDFIVAVACERDLASGIQDCFPIPVYGALNYRPNGPCFNTSFPMPLLDALLTALRSEATAREILAVAKTIEPVDDGTR